MYTVTSMVLFTIQPSEVLAVATYRVFTVGVTMTACVL